MNRLGETIGWALHYLLGLVSGAALGAGLIYGRSGHRSDIDTGLISKDVAFPFILGVALLGAGLGAFLGDRLWMSQHYRMVPPEGPPHTTLTRFVSLTNIIIGAGLILYALYRQIFILRYSPIDF